MTHAKQWCKYTPEQIQALDEMTPLTRSLASDLNTLRRQDCSDSVLAKYDLGAKWLRLMEHAKKQPGSIRQICRFFGISDADAAVYKKYANIAKNFSRDTVEYYTASISSKNMLFTINHWIVLSQLPLSQQQAGILAVIQNGLSAEELKRLFLKPKEKANKTPSKSKNECAEINENTLALETALAKLIKLDKKIDNDLFNALQNVIDNGHATWALIDKLAQLIAMQKQVCKMQKNYLTKFKKFKKQAEDFLLKNKQT